MKSAVNYLSTPIVKRCLYENSLIIMPHDQI